MDRLITPSKADLFLRQAAYLLQSETCRYDIALGRTLRENISADRPFPPFDRVTMDGICCRVAELGLAPLTLKGTQAAGESPSKNLTHGACREILTGAVMPADCDTVIPVEDIEIEGVLVHLKSGARAVAGKFIHRIGSDAEKGAVMVLEGSRLTAAHLGLAASVGATELSVTRRPRVLVLSTGDELVAPDESPDSHQIRQSNGPTLCAAIQNWGAVEVAWRHVGDDFQHLKRELAQALRENDLLVIAGGISMGKKDFVRPVLEQLVGPPRFHGVKQQPGKPLAVWTSKPFVFALPGNPLSALNTLHRYVIPTLCRLSGCPPPSAWNLPFVEARERLPEFTRFFPARVTPEGRVQTYMARNSGDLTALGEAAGFAEIAAGTGMAEEGVYRAW